MARIKSLQPAVRQVDLQHVSNLEVERLRGRARQERNARLAFANPLCVECEKLGLVRAAEEWDHTVPLADGGADHESNLQGLCHDHHAAKTAREAAARALPRPAA